MSRVYVLASDRPLTGMEELSYYRRAVEELGYPCLLYTSPSPRD